MVFARLCRSAESGVRRAFMRDDSFPWTIDVWGPSGGFVGGVEGLGFAALRGFRSSRQPGLWERLRALVAYALGGFRWGLRFGFLEYGLDALAGFGRSSRLLGSMHEEVAKTYMLGLARLRHNLQPTLVRTVKKKIWRKRCLIIGGKSRIVL